MNLTHHQSIFVFSFFCDQFMYIEEVWMNFQTCGRLSWCKLNCCFSLCPPTDQKPTPRSCRALCQLFGWRWVPAGWASGFTFGPSLPLLFSLTGISAERASSFTYIWLFVFCFFGGWWSQVAKKETERMLLRIFISWCFCFVFVFTFVCVVIVFVLVYTSWLAYLV